MNKITKLLTKRQEKLNKLSRLKTRLEKIFEEFKVDPTDDDVLVFTYLKTKYKITGNLDVTRMSMLHTRLSDSPFHLNELILIYTYLLNREYNGKD